MSLGSYRPANLLIRTDSKQSLRPFPFLSRTGNVLQAFLLQNFCILAFFKREHSASRLKSQFSSLKSVFFPRHSLTQFSNLSFIHLLSSQYILHKGLSGASASLFPVYIAVHRKIESLLFFYYGGIMKHNHIAMMPVKYAIMDAR